MLRAAAALLLLVGLLGGCVGPAEPKWASDEEVARAAWVDDGPPSLTLITVINNRTGSGAHTGLLINASQRVLFDPAGTWYHPQLPERNDVHFGISPPIFDFYIDYHTRITYRTVTQTIVVSPEVAELAMRKVLAHGAVPKAQCSISTSAILRSLPGFEQIPRTWFPKQLMRAFGKLPGVKEKVYTDTDPDDNSGVIQAPPAVHVLAARAAAAATTR